MINTNTLPMYHITLYNNHQTIFIYFLGCWRVSQRYVIAVLTAIGITIEYMQRMCLSIMITDMVQAKKVSKQGDACPPYESESTQSSNEVSKNNEFNILISF